MSKYRVTSGIHSIGERILRKGDTIELADEKFAETEGRERFFEKVVKEKIKTFEEIAEEAKGSGDVRFEKVAVPVARLPGGTGASGEVAAVILSSAIPKLAGASPALPLDDLNAPVGKKDLVKNPSGAKRGRKPKISK